jgi:aspartate racemase
MHRVAADVRAQLTVPIIDIVDATAQAVVASGCRRPILLGTLYTLTSGIFSERLKENHKIDTMMPDESARKQIHQMIYSELCNGEIRPRSKQHLLSICQALYAKGADGVILGCTELTLILTAEDFDMPVFDTTKIHASAALDLAIM